MVSKAPLNSSPSIYFQSVPLPCPPTTQNLMTPLLHPPPPVLTPRSPGADATRTYWWPTPPRRSRRRPCPPRKSSFFRCTWAQSSGTPRSSAGALQCRGRGCSPGGAVSDHDFHLSPEGGGGGGRTFGCEEGGTGASPIVHGRDINRCSGNCSGLRQGRAGDASKAASWGGK